MNIYEVGERIADRSGISKPAMKKFIDNLFVEAGIMLELGHDIRIPGFGKLKMISVKARVGRNPKTNEEVPIPPRRRIKYYEK
jgi:integration host factor subunit alpha